jgi:hypothetical protein
MARLTNVLERFQGIPGAHVAVDHADELMTVTAPLNTMPADAREDFVRACRSIALDNDVGLRFIRERQQ